MDIKLNYPVFVFRKKDKMVYVYHNDKHMKTTNTEIFSSTDFKGRIIIDSLGFKYITKKAYHTGYVGLWGISLRMSGKVISFDYNYEEEITKISLNELREMIFNRYPKSRYFHSAWSDINEFEEEMNKCSTFGELARLIGGPPPSSSILLRIIRGY